MSKTSSLIEPGSPADRVCRWFAISTNRGLERTTLQLVQQFGFASASIVTKGLEPAVHAHLLVFTQGEKSMVYQAGPRLAAWAGNEPAAPAMPQPPATPKPKRKPAVRLPDIDPAKLKVRANAPIPPVRTGRGVKGQTRWDPVFEQLQKVGSSVEIERCYYSAIAKAAQTYAKRTGQKLTVRHINPTHFGVWRTA